ncbi:protein-disulfide reductase DsbD domain-containing protein [Mucilaginibacter aquaedulcis]|uniref:protein-disulfide reductase DsbD domain-containing protein n=1 Tax=Mucilaginibacter aquaedulcis TaxID=1187081 RepID=UPI0025B2E32B|nr:protein-disulfide reductase DsbD domain-containing protein [Mucilaginibacter aquaedulcis]MDN3548659.1 protein-disulfide reductase DsbD family protein [Mucilaginibacter aquaedulcis]
MKKIMLLLLVFALCGNLVHASEGNKIPLKVLYVGYDPEKPMPAKLVWYMPSESRYKEFYKTRMPAFKSFLEKNFTVVKTVDWRDYNSKMSDDVDVTIIDAYPVNLPVNFNRPAILIAAVAPDIGIPIGLKFDWYCQCLENDALNIKTQHEIFNTPNKVNLTMVTRPTPGGFFNGFQGATTPKTMPMWRVVTEGFDRKKPYLIGMVAHGEGFADSPDAEVISGGVCLKNAEAVALGRHGNYFMWGFAASPEYMTDEANKVFVNTICYINKFDKKIPIVKKVQQATREEIDEKIYRADEDLYKRSLIARKEGNERLKRMQDSIRALKASGVDIGRGNEMFLKMTLTNDVQSFEDYLKDWQGADLVKQFGTDTKLYVKYYRDNYEYFYPGGFQSVQLDEDAQKLGISNRSLQMLEKCISLLEKDEHDALAHRLLDRYTNEKFTTAKEWRNWYEKNKSKLFYTESGGFKFMVNTYENPVIKANPSAAVSKSKETAGPTQIDPVSVTASLQYAEDKKHADIIVEADILKGWHIYAYLPANSPYIQTETLLELPKGAKSSKSGWDSTSGIPYPGFADVFVYEGRVTFKLNLDMTNVKKGSPIKCGLYYQTCNDKKCMQPQRKVIVLKA